MAPPIHVLGFAGSLRQGSYNRAALRAAAELLPRGTTLEILDLAPIPLYNADVERAGLPEPVRQFKAKIAAADALLVATPEYNHALPGVLKNALDWASRPAGRSPLKGKPVAILGAAFGYFGTVRAQQHLRQLFVAVDAHALNQPQVHITEAPKKFDREGRLTDEPTRERIRKLVQALVAWTQQLATNH